MTVESRNTLVPPGIGRYEVLGELATGGMAQILLARRAGPSGFERLVVIKRILPHLRSDEDFVRMFLDEARIVARIHHPNVVQVYELEREEGELYLVMEYLKGESLFSLMRRLTRFNEQMDDRLAAHAIAEACTGLHAAHELKSPEGEGLELVHRDVSPHNVFISYSGQVKLIDFGIAKATNRATQTRTGELKGKFEYMSPEQCAAEEVDRRSDIYSLGIVLYELTTGRRLFKRANELLTIKAVTEQPVIPPSILRDDYPEELQRICLKALERNRDNRYNTAAEMRRDLMRFVVEGDGALAVPEEGLAALMERLFEERMREKNQLTARAKAGSSLGPLPAAEVDLQYRVPEIDDEQVNAFTKTRQVRAGTPAATRKVRASVPEPASEASDRVPTEPPGRSRAGAAVLVLALAGVVVGWVALGGQDQPETTATRTPAPVTPTPVEPVLPPTPTPTAPSRPAVEASEQVTLTLLSKPRGARLFHGKRYLGKSRSGHQLNLPRSEAPIRLTAKLDGYRQTSLSHKPLVTETITLFLKRKKTPAKKSEPEPDRPAVAVPPPAPSPPPPSQPPAKQPDPFRKFE